jgi:hypothetical protein
MLCLTGCGPNSRVLKLPDGAEVIGRIPRNDDDAQFYLFNNSDLAKSPHSNWTLKINGEEFELASVSPQALKNAGAELLVQDYAPNEVHAFFGWGAKNRDGGVGVAFKDGRVSQVEMRWYLPSPSPFAISFGGSDFFSMPFTESQIHSAFGSSIESNDVYLE